MQMNNKVKEFIEKNIILIEDNKWKEVYNKASRVLFLSNMGNLNSIFLEADIDPLNYLNYIPADYLYNQNIKSFTIPNHIKRIADRAFSGCSSLTSVTIGNGVKRIGNYAFAGCSSLTSLTIGNGVKRIGDYAFSGCRSLTSITFNGTIKQWETIGKDYKWNYNVPASCIVYCSDGKLKI